MKTMQELLGEIILLTNYIETDFPELYRFLDENPMTIPISEQASIDRETMKDYLDGLRQLLEHHLERHQSDKLLGGHLNNGSSIP